ncbi:putative bifunctional diguanylate cyclase/phosphodiesterase [Streptomyces sp. NPDC001780]
MSGTSEGPHPATVATSGTVEPPAVPSPSPATPDAGSFPERHVTGTTAAESHDYRAAFRTAQLAMAVLDREGTVLGANEAFGALLGAEPGTLIEQDAADLVDLASDRRTWHAYRAVLDSRRARFRCTRRLKHTDGRTLWAEVTVSPLPESGTVLLSIADISDRRDLQARLRHLQMHDPVTRLPNRTLFFERLTAALEGTSYERGRTYDRGRAYERGLPYGEQHHGEGPYGHGAYGDSRPYEADRPHEAERPHEADRPHADSGPYGGGRPRGTRPYDPAHAHADTGAEADVYGPGHGGTGRIGLCYLDLDGFKAINDTLGHRTGDQLLAAVATRLTECADHDGYTRSGGHLVARLGGDEFAILVEDSTGTEQLAGLARSVLAALQRPFDLGGQRLAVSASIGVVERAVAGTTPTGLMQAADTTLYWAKADGKARWTLFDPERNAHRMTRQALTSTLRPAVEREEFTLQYQPLVGMADGVVRGVEALVRWNHPQFGTLSPNRFIGIAEEDGSIVPLGRWVLRTACRQARQWQRDHPDTTPLFVSVNVAVRQVWDSDLVADVAGILAETGLAPYLLQLELTESAVMGSAGRPLQALQALSDMGVRIAIDDFGTGYSNLAYLSRLPVSVLKLDGSFVRGFRYDEGVHPSPADETIVEAMVQLAHRLGLTVTAEGVETSGQASRLQRIGCDTGQGWLFSRPVAPERIAEMIAARRPNV